MGLANPGVGVGGHLEVAKPGSIETLKETTPQPCLLRPRYCGPQQAKEATMAMLTPTPGLQTNCS